MAGVLVTLGILAGIVLVLGIVAIVSASAKANRRQTSLILLAQNRGWTYEAQDRALVTRFAGAPFGSGSGPLVSNVITGHSGGRIFTAFDYSFQTTAAGTVDGTGVTISRELYGVVAVNLGVVAPWLSVMPQVGPLRRWAGKVSGTARPIGIEAFDRQFRVETQAPEFARDVFSPALVDFLMSMPQLAFRLDRDSLLIISPRQQTIDEIDGKLTTAAMILDRIGPDVWARLGAAPA